jgi:O-antigen/teichoic acid export membrane protein
VNTPALGGRKRPSGVSLILVATAISGVAAYGVTLFVPAVIGLADYKAFSIFWSLLYLVVGALIGIQQEVTRGTQPVSFRAKPEVSRARNFGGVVGLAVAVAIVASAPLWVDSAFPGDGWSMVWPLTVGASSFVMVAVLSGSLYGIAQWRPLALLMVGDALLRLIAVFTVLAFSADTVALAWAVAIPFPATLLIFWWFIRKSVVGKTQLDVGYQRLVWNVSRTVVAAASTGLMVSGFPFLLGLTSSGESDELLGLYILCITVTRAPLIVVAMSLQSYLIVHFRDARDRFWRDFILLQLIVFGGGVVIATLVWAAGPAVFAWLYPGQIGPTAGFLAVLVLSSALMAALFISATAVLSRSLHFVFTFGWVVAALITVVALVLPLDFDVRVYLAMLVGPTVGLLVHTGCLLALKPWARNL